ncbi:hypothetical protein PGB90_010359 [Kerria lacca]
MKIVLYFILINFILLSNSRKGLTQNNVEQNEWPPGWTEKCLSCICEATSSCNQTLECLGEYCGMFLISRSYWIDAGSPVLQKDNVNETEAFQRCVTDPYCASRTVNQYVQRFIQDCNNDGILSCDDYARLHYLGYLQCTRALRNVTYYRIFQTCFQRNFINA